MRWMDGWMDGYIYIALSHLSPGHRHRRFNTIRPKLSSRWRGSCKRFAVMPMQISVHACFNVLAYNYYIACAFMCQDGMSVSFLLHSLAP